MDASAHQPVNEQDIQVCHNWQELFLLSSGDHLGDKQIEQPNYHRGQLMMR